MRHALGVDRIALFGLSYGTKQALAYAAAHPEHVDRLLLDSTVLPDGPDPLGLASLRAIPTALDSICHAGACATVSGDPASDFAKLANRLDAQPLIANAPVYTTQETPTLRRVRIDGLGLLSLVTASDLNSGIAIALPAAVGAALSGRPGVLERTVALLSEQDTSAVNNAVFLATTCNDLQRPATTDLSRGIQRRRQPTGEPSSRMPSRLSRPNRWVDSEAGRQSRPRSSASTGRPRPASSHRTRDRCRTCLCSCSQATAMCARPSQPGPPLQRASRRVDSSSRRGSDIPSSPLPLAWITQSASGSRVERRARGARVFR